MLVIFDTPYPQVIGGGQRRVFEVFSRLKIVEKEWLSLSTWDAEKTPRIHGIRYIGKWKLPKLYNDLGNRNIYEPLKFFFLVIFNIKKICSAKKIWVAQWPLIHLIPILIICKINNQKLIIDWWEVWSKSNWIGYSKSFRLIGFMGYIIQSSTLLLVKYTKPIVITDNSSDFSKLKTFLGSNYKDLYYIHNGIPLSEINKADEFVDHCDIISLGRLKNHKGLDLLIEAMNILKENYHCEPKLRIIGDGPERESLKKLAHKLNVQQQIIFEGSIKSFPRIYSLMKNALVCALTTHNGGGGNLTLLEAFGCNLPVIAFKSPNGIDPNLIRDNETGILVEKVDSSSLAEAIYTFLSDDNLQKTMKNNIKKEKNLLTWDAIAEQYQRIIDGN